MRDWVTEFLKKPVYLAVLLVVLVAVSFLAGSWHHSRKAPVAAGERKILYYVDPMNPAHTSPTPGLAPCGMKLEPVYADGGSQAPGASLPPGSIKITPEKQQLLGVRVAPVEQAPFIYTFRALGKVAVDETRIYRLNASTDGWIRETYNNSTGSVVRKDETLATFYSPEFLAAEQAYIYALTALDRFRATGQETPAQIETTKRSIQQYIDTLHNLGMSDLQIKEIEKTRTYTENIRMVAPATSFILARNVSPGQRYNIGTEWYRLADLSRVWVLADLFENEAQHIHPGEKVRVTYPYQKKTFQATVSEVLPVFDPATRTLKVRLETENPGYMLRPEMFVDLDFPVKLPPSIHVPVDAVLDSGFKQTVFVNRGNGFFEPRKVETGWRLGDRVEITRGLETGEKIVISGNFLIDSESRMKLAAAGFLGTVVKDPVCGNDLDEVKAKSAGRKSDYQGKTYYFCSDGCQQKFDQTPERFAAKPDTSAAHEQVKSSTQAPIAAEKTPKKTKDPVCGEEVDEGQAKATGLTSDYEGKTYYFCSYSCNRQFDKDPDHYLD